MTCPACKNPIMNPAPNCEWCGSILSSAQNSHTPSFSPTKIFKITGRGTVINGRVKFIESDRKLIASFEGKCEIGIII